MYFLWKLGKKKLLHKKICIIIEKSETFQVPFKTQCLYLGQSYLGMPFDALWNKNQKFKLYVRPYACHAFTSAKFLSKVGGRGYVRQPSCFEINHPPLYFN